MSRSDHSGGSVWMVTVKVAGLLLVMLGATVTTIGPEVAPDGMVMVMEVALQELTVTGVPLSATTLLPCVAPNAEPLMTTWVPTGPLAGEIPEMFGAGAAAVEMETLS